MIDMDPFPGRPGKGVFLCKVRKPHPTNRLSRLWVVHVDDIIIIIAAALKLFVINNIY